MRAGVTGPSVMRAPKGDRASSIALASAAGGEMAPPSPTPLTSSGLRGRGMLEVDRLDERELVGPRQRVVHQGAGEELARRVVDDLLAEAPAHPLGDAAVDLPVHEQGIDHAARSRGPRRSARSRTRPVSGSTSTTATWTALA